MVPVLLQLLHHKDSVLSIPKVGFHPGPQHLGTAAWRGYTYKFWKGDKCQLGSPFPALSPNHRIILIERDL